MLANIRLTDDEQAALDHLPERLADVPTLERDSTADRCPGDRALLPIVGVDQSKQV